MSVIGLIKFGVAAAGFVIVAGAVHDSVSSRETTSAPSVAEARAPDPKAIKNETLQRLSLQVPRWNAGASGSVMVADFVIKNNSSSDVKDLTVECVHSAASGTQIDSNKRTIYQVFPKGKNTKVPKFNMGFIHSQAEHTMCSIVDFLPA